jgi:gamma-glutamyl:cysteine ligase YbdK (ATP-grasp superfamily)
VTAPAPLGLFEGVGIEIEYMIADRETLDVRPIADRLITAEVGTPDAEIERGDMAWSNELALHVIEFKTNGPAPSLHGLAARFQEEVRHANLRLAPLGACLMPTGMHPWMDPERELRLWPHGDDTIYRTFHRIFDCRGHGWANLQSVHLNLPFRGDEEFARLHAAIRTVLPLLPALAASSPLVEGRRASALDARLDFYARNAARVPSVTGAVVPEPVSTRAAYERDLLGRIYADLAPLDPGGVLRHEWVNARGCIARFDRSAIEVRLLDVQERPAADLAVAAAASAAIGALVRGELDGAPDAPGSTERLARVLARTVAEGDLALVEDAAYRAALGWRGGPCRAGELWQHLIETHLAPGGDGDEWADPLRVILAEGCLARRIRERVGGDLRHEHLVEIYRELCACLDADVPFRGVA